MTVVEVATRYVGAANVPVECAVFHKRDGTTVVVRLLPEQMLDLADRLRLHAGGTRPALPREGR